MESFERMAASQDDNIYPLSFQDFMNYSEVLVRKEINN